MTDDPLFALRNQIADFLETLVDAGTFIDRGFGCGQADLHPIIGGIEFYITITVAPDAGDDEQPTY